MAIADEPEIPAEFAVPDVDIVLVDPNVTGVKLFDDEPEEPKEEPLGIYVTVPPTTVAVGLAAVFAIGSAGALLDSVDEVFPNEDLSSENA